MTDYILPFRIENAPAHGRIVRLSDCVSTVLERHDYPEAVGRLLGEALTIAALIGSQMKFEGRFIIQSKSDGAVPMLVADYNNGHMRGLAHFDAQADFSALTSAAQLMGAGHITFTIDQTTAQTEDMQRYQGIVPLEGDDLTQMTLNYFSRSEQLEARLKLATAPLFLPGGKKQWRAGGIILQQTAQDYETTQTDEDWQRLSLLFDTTSIDELLDDDLPAQDLAYRLFHEDGVRAFPEQNIKFHCPCSHERVRAMLMSLPADDRIALSEQDKIAIACEFCNQSYIFSPDIWEKQH